LPNTTFFILRAREEALLGANPMSRGDQFRKNADDCRQQAEKSRSLLDKERWLKIAEHWLQMAQEADAEADR
jgi:hypothetical protein